MLTVEKNAGTGRRSEPATRDPTGRAGRWADRLPSGRAALGATLVVLAAAGVLAAHRAAVRPTTTRFVVATREIPAGTRLRNDDLGTLPMDLPSGVPAVAADDAGSIVGTVTLHPLRPRELIRPGDVADSDRTPDAGSVEVPVEVDPARALGPSVNAGSRVDVLSTDPDGAGTAVIARDVLVVAADRRSDAIGSSGGVRFRLAVPDATTATAVVDASVRSQLTLVLPNAGASRG